MGNVNEHGDMYVSLAVVQLSWSVQSVVQLMHQTAGHVRSFPIGSSDRKAVTVAYTLRINRHIIFDSSRRRNRPPRIRSGPNMQQHSHT